MTTYVESLLNQSIEIVTGAIDTQHPDFIWRWMMSAVPPLYWGGHRSGASRDDGRYNLHRLFHTTVWCHDNSDLFRRYTEKGTRWEITEKGHWSQELLYRVIDVKQSLGSRIGFDEHIQTVSPNVTNKLNFVTRLF